MFWRGVVPFIYPTLEAIARVPDAMLDFQHYHHIRRLRLWLWQRFFELVAFMLSVEIGAIMSLSYWDHHWLVYVARCLAESYVTTWVVREMVEVCYCFGSDPYFPLPRRMVKYLFVACLAQFRHRCLAFVIMAFQACWLSIILLEVAVDEFRSFRRRNDPPPEVKSPTTFWNLVSLLKSSTNGYLSRQFFTVTVSETSRLDDPFWPDQISSVYMVELRRRNMLWQQFIVWQASLLNGGKKKIHEFNVVDRQWTDGQLFAPRCRFNYWTNCFESNGVIFIREWHWGFPVTLLVIDTRHGKSAAYLLPREEPNYQSMVSAYCLQRIFLSDGTLQGWRVRLVGHSLSRCQCHVLPFGHRQCLRKIDFELCQKATLINEEEVIFGPCANWSIVHSRLVRTSRGLFGVYHDLRLVEQVGPSMLYDVASDRFVYFPNFEALLRSDRPFALYYYTPSPTNPLAVGDKYGHLCPTVLTSQETVYCTEDGKVFRSEFKLTSLKYVAAKSVFRAKPNLRSEMSAEEFRRSTGIGGMQSHFDN